MKKTAALALLAVLAATGCASAEPEAPAMQPLMAPTTSTAEPTAEPGTSAEPVTDGTRVIADAPGLDAAVDATYLAHTHAAGTERAQYVDTLIPGLSDAQLFAAAVSACEQLPGVSGVYEDVRLFENEVPDGEGVYSDSAKVASLASVYYCTEWEPDVVIPYDPENYS